MARSRRKIRKPSREKRRSRRKPKRARSRGRMRNRRTKGARGIREVRKALKMNKLTFLATAGVAATMTAYAIRELRRRRREAAAAAAAARVETDTSQPPWRMRTVSPPLPLLWGEGDDLYGHQDWESGADTGAWGEPVDGAEQPGSAEQDGPQRETVWDAQHPGRQSDTGEW